MPPVKDPEQDRLSRARNQGQADYERKIVEPFEKNRKKSSPDSHEFGLAYDDEKNSSLDDDFRKQEENPANPDEQNDRDIDERESRGDTNFVNNVEAPGAPSRFQGLKKKRNAIVVALTMFGATAGIFAFISAPAYYLVHFKETMVGKFGDRLQSLQQVRVNRIVAKQLASDPLTAGCGTIKVKCRYKGMTNRQIKKFKSRNPGVQIRTDGRTVFGRHKVQSIAFTDDNGRFRYVTPKDFKRYAKSSPAFQKLILNYNKSKVGMWRDKQAGKVYVKLKLSLAKIRAPRGPPQTAQQIKQQKDAKKAATAARRAALATKYSAAIRTSNIISTICAIKGLVAIAKESIKIKQAVEMAQFAFKFGNTADTIKLGLADGDAEITNNISNLGDTLTKTDENGKTAADSFGFQYASYGTLSKDKGNLAEYQLGLNSERGFLGKIDAASQGVPGLGEVSAAIEKVLNPTVCLAGGVISIGFCIVTVGYGCVATAAGMIALFNLATPLITKFLAKSPDIKDAEGGDAGDAATGGFSYLSKTNNQYHGAMPLTKPQAKQYDKFLDNAQGEGNWENTNTIQSLDMHNPKSFAGKLAGIFLPSAMRISASASNIPSVLTSFPASSLANLTSTTQAKTSIDGEYDLCEDGDYQELDLATDPFCVPQYGLDPSMPLGDSDYNNPVAAVPEGKPHKNGFNLAWLFEAPTAKAAPPNDTRGFTPDNRFDADKVVDFMLGGKPWIDGEGIGIEYSDVDDDFVDYTENCLETTDPIGPDSPDMCKPKKCYAASSATDEFRYCMYSQYALDSGIDDQLEDRDAGASSVTADDAADDSASGQAGEVKALAQELLDNPKVTYPYTDTTGLNVREVLKVVARTGKGTVNSPDVDFHLVDVSADMLQALVDYAKTKPIGLNALTNADHSPTSNHYKGIAIDIACAPALDRAAFETIARRYGGENNGEVCPGDDHWHYDFPKQAGD